MSSRPSAAWIVLAHVSGAAMIGALDAARLHSGAIAAAAVPMFALTGLIAALCVLTVERVAANRPWWQAALILAAPALIVFAPVAATLFDGAYAQTLAVAKVAPFVLPVVLWIASAGAIAAGRRILRATDLTTRSLVLLAIALVTGGLIVAERRVLGTGYPSAHLGATLAISVMAGIAIRICYRGGLPRIVGFAVAAATLSLAIMAALGGLGAPADRQLLATYGDQTRDLVGLWRKLVDLDRDGTSRILGGGDCDDLDRTRHPGAVDTPGDGIDQDCDGADAKPYVATVAAPAPEDASAFRARAEIQRVLAATPRMSVLLVSVDALRGDLLAPDAPDRADFPRLTRLLEDSVWFTHAFAPASGTDVSLATLLTGRFDPFQPVASTLPEAMKASGRRTFAAIPAEVLRYAGETLIKRGVDKLTTVYTDYGQADVGDHVSASATTKAGIKALDEVGSDPFFIWVHYFDVHEHHQIKVTDEQRAKVASGGTPKIHDYRALLREVDDQIGRMLDEVTARGLADHTIVVFMSDHGESLGDDPRLLETHGKVTYAPLVRVPIAFHVPGVAAGQRTDLVSLVDIAPTLLDLLGVTPAMTLDGTNLVVAVLDGPAALRPVDRALAIHEQDQWSLVEWPFQLLVRPADNLIELYNLVDDPLQHRDLSAAQPDVVTRLKARYAAFPTVVVDRTPAGRYARERQAQQRPSPAQR